MQVILSDGLPVEVRRLGLFELDGKGREIIGVYRYSLLLATGQIVEDEYDIRALTYTPTAPDMPANEVQPNTPEWYQLREYETYQCALAHEKLRVASFEGYVNDIAAYILNNCIQEQDRQRIIEPEDWRLIQQMALVPQLTEEGVAACLRDTFPGLVWEPGDFGRPANDGRGQGEELGIKTMGTRDDSGPVLD